MVTHPAPFLRTPLDLATQNTITSNIGVPKFRKKTVVEMLLTESYCLTNISKVNLQNFIEDSQILEADRKKYLLTEISRSRIGSTELWRL
jgi:hypothetical protein